jgi:hypothetical protein
MDTLRLRAYPRRKAGQPKVKFVYFQDTAIPSNVLNYDLRREAERLSAAGMEWQLYHVNVMTRVPFPRCMQPGEPDYEAWHEQAEYLYIPSRGAFGCAFGDALDILTWHTSSGFVAADLDGYFKAFYRAELEPQGEGMMSDLLWGDWLPTSSPAQVSPSVSDVKVQPRPVKTRKARAPRSPLVVPGFGDWATYQAALTAYKAAQHV